MAMQQMLIASVGGGDFQGGTGGTTSTFGSYTLHKFSSSADFVVGATDGEVDILLVGGGGNGGMCNQASNYGGGGGAGGLVWVTGISVTAGSTYSMVVGSAGNGCGAYGGQGADGTNSTGFSLTALGGGGGG